jgi:decaprenylphospho-beta-D-erythro-pentofuranosid-2-ulose 2-reductase
VFTRPADLNELQDHAALIEQVWNRWGGLDTALVAHGLLGNQKQDQSDPASANRVLETNFLGPASLLGLLANRFEAQRSGSLAAISSVAGDRGRPTNYIYGAGKAGLDAYLSGLRARLGKAGVNVLTVKPGFVDTPMTAHLPKNPLFASAESVARGIHRALSRRRSRVYLPWFWRPIMTIIRLLPEPIFKRLNL